MNMNRWKAVAAVLAVALSVAPGAGTAAAEESTELKGTGADTDARGTVVLEFTGSSDCDRLVTINTSGLVPGARYSVWMVTKDGKTRPAGLTNKNHFTTNPAGMGSYTWFAWVRNVYWKTMEITRQPEGASVGKEKSEGATVVLSARITP